MATSCGDVFSINGVNVQFPYTPYECQRDFMEKVLETLQSSSNAALESPTGTGKTLSLLCSAIAWIQEYKEKLKPQTFANNTGLTNPCINAPNHSILYPRIYYASRTHSQLQQVVRELNKTKYKSVVRLVTLAGRDKLCLNERVLKEQNSEVRGQLCRTMTRARKCNFYNTLEKDADSLDAMYSGALDGNALDIEDLLNTARKFRFIIAVELTYIRSPMHCPFYRARQQFEQADLVLLPYNYLLDPKVREMYEIKVRGNILIFDEAHNIESVAEQSVSIDFSTKTLSIAIREAKKTLEMVIEEEEKIRKEMDDNGPSFSSLMDKRGGKRQKQKEDDKEKQVSKQDVASLLMMLQSFEEQLISLNSNKKEGKELANLPGRVFPGYKMVEILKAADIHRHQRESICLLIDRIGLFLATNAEQNHGIWAVRGTSLSAFSTLISRVFVDTFEDMPTQNGKLFNGNLLSLQQQQNIASNNFQLFIEQYKNEKRKYFSNNSLNEEETNFDGLVEENDGLKEKVGITLHYWCFNAGVAMRFLDSRGTRSIIFASGTLAPLPSFISTMGIHFGAILESKHCANKNQLVIGALRKGSNGTDLLGTFQNRNDPTYKQTIGELILQVASVTPQGMLVFFPSYSQMNTFVEFWKNLKLANGQQFWALLECQKQLFIEQKDKFNIPILLKDFDSAVYGSVGGALLFAVCRGKLSEGIDFADSHCRSLIIVGIPFPPLFDSRVILKKSYLLEAANTKNKNSNNYLLSADEWYKVEGTRTVNQALGRIIRHKEDFGAVILADCRYATMDRNMFPSWMRDSIKIHSEPNTILPCIERFFTERGFLGRSSKNVKNNFESSIICKKQNYSSPKDNISSRKRNERHFILNENILEIYDQFQVEKENDENSGGTCSQINLNKVNFWF
ncbi:unnamed protein product [Meloidogyne enterolobii]|uniref:Uncharacterized protein n=1 Tax=Meloidogyne enterolobii TaxID=390850 RepID=A0ACB0ZY96_MELEN